MRIHRSKRWAVSGAVAGGLLLIALTTWRTTPDLQAAGTPAPEPFEALVGPPGPERSVVFVGGQSNARPELAAAVADTLAAQRPTVRHRVLGVRHNGTPLRFWTETDTDPADPRHPAAAGHPHRTWYGVDFRSTEGVSGGRLFEALEANGPSSPPDRLVALVWFQGEADTSGAREIATWAGRFQRMRDRLASDFHGGTPLPTVLLQIAADEERAATEAKNPAATRDWLKRVRRLRAVQAEYAAAHPEVVLVDSARHARHDVWHVETRGGPDSASAALGREAAAALLPLLSERGASLPPSGPSAKP